MLRADWRQRWGEEECERRAEAEEPVPLKDPLGGRAGSMPIPAAAPLIPHDRERTIPWPHQLHYMATPLGRRALRQSGQPLNVNWDREAHMDTNGDGRVSFDEAQMARGGSLRAREVVLRGDSTQHPREILQVSQGVAKKRDGAVSVPLLDVHVYMRQSHPRTYHNLLRDLRSRHIMQKKTRPLAEWGSGSDRSPFAMCMGHSVGAASQGQPASPRAGILAADGDMVRKQRELLMAPREALQVVSRQRARGCPSGGIADLGTRSLGPLGDISHDTARNGMLVHSPFE